MDRDEEAIRLLVTTWMEASAAGNLPRVLELMADDVVFLGAGRPPMRGKEGFAAASRAMEEVRVFGEWAYCWNELTLAVHPIDGGAPSHLSGPALSILRKQPDGRWLFFRDANMLSPVPQPSR
jgi:uncharacterized protein (TIGR02246 family)